MSKLIFKDINQRQFMVRCSTPAQCKRFLLHLDSLNYHFGIGKDRASDALYAMSNMGWFKRSYYNKNFFYFMIDKSHEASEYNYVSIGGQSDGLFCTLIDYTDLYLGKDIIKTEAEPVECFSVRVYIRKDTGVFSQEELEHLKFHSIDYSKGEYAWLDNIINIKLTPNKKAYQVSQRSFEDKRKSFYHTFDIEKFYLVVES